MYVLVELVRDGDTRHIECLSSADENLQRRSTNVGNGQ